MAKVTTQQDQS